jgi:hypothetical protein
MGKKHYNDKKNYGRGFKGEGKKETISHLISKIFRALFTTIKITVNLNALTSLVILIHHY